jgi:hypothetical protein
MKKPFLKIGAFLILFSVLLLSSCDLFLGPPRLLVMNDTEGLTILRVELVGYDFDSLNILGGTSQEFLLYLGMPGGYDNIAVTVHNRGSALGPVRYPSKAYNFADGEVTVVRLIDELILD